MLSLAYAALNQLTLMTDPFPCVGSEVVTMTTVECAVTTKCMHNQIPQIQTFTTYPLWACTRTQVHSQVACDSFLNLIEGYRFEFCGV